jgi:hypothetical protein
MIRPIILTYFYPEKCILTTILEFANVSGEACVLVAEHITCIKIFKVVEETVAVFADTTYLKFWVRKRKGKNIFTTLKTD